MYTVYVIINNPTTNQVCHLNKLTKSQLCLTNLMLLTFCIILQVFVYGSAAVIELIFSDYVFTSAYA